MLLYKVDISKIMNQYIMPIHFKNGATVSTPDKFAMKQRCLRLKRELKKNKLSTFKRWGCI